MQFLKPSSRSYKISPLSNGLCQSQKDGNESGTGSGSSCEERETDWSSIYLCSFFAFSASVQFTIFFASLWPFMKTLDNSVSVGFFGAVIAMYSLSQIVVSPLLGIWSNRIERLKPPLLLCNMIMFVGNFLYLVVELFPQSWSRYVLMISRLIAGIGYAQIGLLKSHAAAASVVEDRSKAVAYLTGGNSLGTALGPSFQILFTWVPNLPICLWPGYCFNLSMFTAPALFVSLINIGLIFLLSFGFRESYVGIWERRADKKVKNEEDGPRLPPYDRVALFVCFAMRFTQFFIITNLETIGAAYAMMMFLWPPTEVVFYESIAHSARGALSLLVYFCYIVLDFGQRVNDRVACLCCLCALLLFHVFTFSWPFLPDHVATFDSKVINSTIGCDWRQLGWCHGLKHVNVWLYYTLMVLFIGLAFPNINVTMNTLFSRIIGPRLQSKQQGLLEMYGGMGRMLGPLLIGYLYHSYGPRAIWAVESAEIGLMMLLWVVFYKRLVPLQLPEEMNY